VTDLSDFNGGIQPPDPPQIKMVKKVPLAFGENRKTAGWIGPVPERKALGFVTKRDSQEHRIRALNAYSISEKVLKRLTAQDVQVVLIHEKDRDRVLEYTLQQFRDADNVPEKYLMRPDDPQRFVRLRGADSWHHADTLYIPRDEPIEYG